MEEFGPHAQDVYARHDYAALGDGQLLFGIKMESDCEMLEPAFTVNKPAITGIANFAATITVRQYGKVIYQKNVPQGPFSLTDFNNNGNGDVDVEVLEADGSSRRFPMASVVALAQMAKGALGYSASAGNVSNGNGYFSTIFAQGICRTGWERTRIS